METLIIIDWDDTLFPTSWSLKNNINMAESNYFSRLDITIHKLLSKLLENSKVIIVTNAMKKWITMSGKTIPNSYELIKDNINIVSARDIYQKKHPSKNSMWKKLVFKRLIDDHFKKHIRNKNKVQNILSLGDAEHEYKATINLYDNCMPRLLKTIRFMSNPSFDGIIDQLEILDKSLDKFVKNKRNMDLYFYPNLET